MKNGMGLYNQSHKCNLWRNVSHLKVPSSLSTFTPIAFGDSMKGNKLDLLVYWLAHVHQNLHA